MLPVNWTFSDGRLILIPTPLNPAKSSCAFFAMIPMVQILSAGLLGDSFGKVLSETISCDFWCTFDSAWFTGSIRLLNATLCDSVGATNTIVSGTKTFDLDADWCFFWILESASRDVVSMKYTFPALLSPNITHKNAASRAMNTPIIDGSGT